MAIQAIPYIRFSTKLLTTVYQPINPLGLGEDCFLLKFINHCVIPINISYDGVTDHDYLTPSSIIEISSGNFPAEDTFASTTIIYVKADTGKGAGYLYVVGYYSS